MFVSYSNSDIGSEHKDCNCFL